MTSPIKIGLSKTWFKINYIWNKIRKKTEQLGHWSHFLLTNDFKNHLIIEL